MSPVIQILQTTFQPLVLIFTVSNLAAMGLQVRMPEVMVALRNKKSLALGMGTRNIAAVLAAALAIPNADPLIVTMTIMWTLWSVVLAAIGAKIFAKQAGKTVPGGTARVRQINSNGRRCSQAFKGPPGPISPKRSRPGLPWRL